MDISTVTDLFAGVAFPVAVSAWLLVRTTSQLERITEQLTLLAATIDRMEQREAARHERL